MFKSNKNLDGIINTISERISLANDKMLLASVAFIVLAFIVLCFSIAYRKQMRHYINPRIAFPILGLAIIVIPLIDDYVNLIFNYRFFNSLSTYLSSSHMMTKLVIYFVAFSFIFNSKNMISAIAPLAFITLLSSVISDPQAAYAINVLEYSLVLFVLLFALALTKQRYSFINFMDSLLITGGITLFMHFAQVITLHKLVNGDLSSFAELGQYVASWLELASSFVVIVLMQFIYLFVSTKMVTKLSMAKTWELIKLEDKYRKANIEFNLNAKDDLSQAIPQFTETENVDLLTDILFQEQVQEIELTQHAKVQRVLVKAKGIRSPSCF